MTFYAVSMVLRYSEETLGRRLVLISLADFAHDDGSNAYPSVKTLADRARLSERQVKRCLKGMTDDGVIAREGETKGGIPIWRIILPCFEGGDNLSEGGDNLSTDLDNLSPPLARARENAVPIDGQAGEVVIEEGKEVSVSAASGDGVSRLWDRFLLMRVRSPKAIRQKALDPETRRMIGAALRVGTEEEWLSAIDALLLSPHHVGKNDRGKVYLDPRHVFSRCTHGTVRQHLDWLLDISLTATPQIAGSTSGHPGVTDARINEAKRSVMQAHFLAGSEARRQGDESEQFLKQHGIQVLRENPADPPTFTFATEPGQEGTPNGPGARGCDAPRGTDAG